MLSKNTIKLIKSLVQKKYRQKHQVFLVEGDKNVIEVLNSKIKVKSLFGTPVFLEENRNALKRAENVDEVAAEDIKRASLLKSPQNSFALCLLPENKNLPEIEEELSFYLDGIRDPGNLGTIIRTCDWFGIKNLYCSEDTTDVFSPKVIQATMGSFTRVNLFYTEFQKLKKTAIPSDVKILGTFMDGTNIYKCQIPKKALVVLGNEGKGIRKEVEQVIDYRIAIPRFQKNMYPESLNVAISASIICSEFKRNSAK